MDLNDSVFTSKAPLLERVDIINFKTGKYQQYYWMLSFQNEAELGDQRAAKYSNLAPYEDNEGELVDCYDLEDNYEINPTKSGKYMTSFYVPSALCSVIIGPRGSKLKELQENTQTFIKVPKPNEIGTVKITGPSERSVASARTQIALILLAKREKIPVTHFVSIPVISDDIILNYHRFKDEILTGPSTRGVDDTIFQKVEKFHLTIITLTLLDDKEIDEAKAILNKCRENIKDLLPQKKYNLTFKGVEIMNDDPSEVDVLYGKVELNSPEDDMKFQIAADEIMNSFYKNGLVRKQYDSVKLHVTLMNSIFRKTDEFQAKDKTKRESFDATYIMEKYQNYYFGSAVFDQIQLSIRFTTAKNSGYYESANTIYL